ncbi:ubiquinone biosynthesis protein COQ9 [Microthyrium microscopicum]|uniref:Ubiquinone biosynthesis protein n=1 Tax=Microthyrium microscopicum TaxID=703497 RepID=A0A6A6TYF1_9PEZI|nr:ubiquinone biosynthesis protein COQ9 [Microthyrium microscopicum]
MNTKTAVRLTRQLRHPLPLQRTTIISRRQVVPSSTSSYHSYDHPTPPPYSDTAKSILSASLNHIPEHGFTRKSLSLGAKDAGYLSISTNLFPQGAFDLILYYLATSRLKLQDSVHGRDGHEQQWASGKIDVKERVKTLVFDRLRFNKESGVIKRWPEALAVMAQPTYVPQSFAELSRLADDIYFLAGDTSVDTTWYTKRASLAAIYAAAEVYQTQDQSAQNADTRVFVDSRFKELESAQTGVSSVAEWVGYTTHSFINVLRSKGAQI